MVYVLYFSRAVSSDLTNCSLWENLNPKQKPPNFTTILKKSWGLKILQPLLTLKFLFPPPPEWLISSQYRQVFWQLDVFIEGQNHALLSLAEKQSHAEMALPVAQKGVATVF